MRARAQGIALAALLACSLPPAVSAADEQGYVPGELIVRFDESAFQELQPPAVPAWLRPFAVESIGPALRVAQGGRLTPLERAFGLHRVFRLAVPAQTDVEALAERVGSLPQVEHAYPNWLGRGGTVVSDDTYFTSQQWALRNTGQTGGTSDADIDADDAWAIATGRPETRVAVLDSGIDGDHREFVGRVARGGEDLEIFEGGPIPDGRDHDPESDHPHGNWVGGVIGAAANNGFVMTGVDWWARLVPIKVLRFDNGGSTTDLIDGVLLTARLQVDVSNMSLIRYPDNPDLADAIGVAHAAGVIQIGCNGNDGIDEDNYPASYPDVISTGWTDDDDLRYVDSNFTSTLDIVAPGADVRTVVWNTTADVVDRVWGCSFATPHVAGVASVMRAIDPTLTHEQVRDVLFQTAEDEVGDPGEDTPGRDDYHGHGRLNMHDALQALGIVSRDELHVERIELERIDASTLEVRVAVLDDLTGAEGGVQVDGTLTLPDTSTVPLSGTTSSTGWVALAYQPGGALPAGTFDFAVDALTKSGFTYDPADDRESSRSHDPDLDGLHVAAIDLFPDFTSLNIEVVVHDDDGVPQGGVQIDGTLTPPSGPPINFTEDTTWAGGGEADFDHAPGGDLAAGSWTFQVTSLSKTGFTYESGKNVETSDAATIDGRTADPDGDGVTNENDNCRQDSNAAQTDADLDGVGDDCDGCPNHWDQLQVDHDGDGTGDRCDCAPYDASRTELAEVDGLAFDASKTTFGWLPVIGADYYDVSRGLLSALDGSDYGGCVSDDQPATTFTDGDTPPAGDGYFYLVRGDDATCGPGDGRVNLNPGACTP